MLNVRQILVSAHGRAAFRVCLLITAVALVGCGQSGALYLPKDPAAANRATLPDLLTPRMPRSADPAAPAPTNPATTPERAETTK